MVAVLVLTFAGLSLIFLEFFLRGAIMAIGGTLLLASACWLYYLLVSQEIYSFFGFCIALGVALFLVIRCALSCSRKKSFDEHKCP